MNKDFSKKSALETIKDSPLLSAIIIYIIFNILSAIMMGGFTTLALLTNLFPGLMGYFLAAMYHEQRQNRKKKIAKIKA